MTSELSPDRLLGRSIAHFRILSVLGSGGMGVVYRATDVSLWRDVALKVLRSHSSEEGEQRLRFLREARAAAAVSHPNIATIFEVGIDDGVPYIAMELVQGTSLRVLCESRPSPQRALKIGLGVAEGLARAHDKGVLHRDLKPENVVVDDDDTPKILDFGLARALGPSVALGEVADPTIAGSVKGTFGYLSPEQARGEPLDARSDVYALGLLLFELLSGQRAVAPQTPIAMLVAVLDGSPAPLTTFGVDAALARIVGRCLERDPKDRYPHAAAVRDALLSLGSLRPPPAWSTPSDALVGREAELASLVTALDDETPIALLTGPPGIGKSRLAEAVRQHLARGEARWTLNVPLGHLADADAVLDEILCAVGASRAITADPGQALASALRQRGRVLLVLDSVEGPLDGLLDVLIGCLLRAPDARVLVTSRGRPTKGVWQLPLGPLDSRSGTELLRQRTGATDASLRAILEGVARLLAGHPLAIELVAPHLTSLPLASGVLVELAELFARTPVDPDARLAAVLGWTTHELPDIERRVLVTLAAFRGGFPTDGLETVLGLSGPACVAAIAALEGRALVHRREGRGSLSDAVHARFDAGSVEGVEAARGHASWVSDLSDRARRALRAGSELDALDALLAERVNVLALLDRARLGAPGLLDHAASAVGVLAEILSTRGGAGTLPRTVAMLAERTELTISAQVDALTSAALLHLESAPDDAWRFARAAVVQVPALADLEREVMALSALSRAEYQRGRYDEAIAIAEDALARARAGHAPHLVERAQIDCGRGLGRRERFGEARALMDAALESATARQAFRVLPEIHVALAWAMTMSGEVAAGIEAGSRAVDGARASKSDAVLAHALLNRGTSLAAIGRVDAARCDLLEAQHIFERRGEQLKLALALANLALMEHEAGQLPAALNLYDRSVALLTELGEDRQRSMELTGRAAVLAQMDCIEEAERDLAAADELVMTLDERVPRVVLSLMRGHLDIARARHLEGPARAAILGRVLRSIEEVYTPDESGRSLAQSSDLVRAAGRILDFVMRSDPRTAPKPRG